MSTPQPTGNLANFTVDIFPTWTSLVGQCFAMFWRGSYARLMKIKLQNRGPRFSTFIDCDDLNDLTKLCLGVEGLPGRYWVLLSPTVNLSFRFSISLEFQMEFQMKSEVRITLLLLSCVYSVSAPSAVGSVTLAKTHRHYLSWDHHRS